MLNSCDSGHKECDVNLLIPLAHLPFEAKEYVEHHRSEVNKIAAKLFEISYPPALPLVPSPYTTSRESLCFCSTTYTQIIIRGRLLTLVIYLLWPHSEQSRLDVQMPLQFDSLRNFALCNFASLQLQFIKIFAEVTYHCLQAATQKPILFSSAKMKS